MTRCFFETMRLLNVNFQIFNYYKLENRHNIILFGFKVIMSNQAIDSFRVVALVIAALAPL